MAEQHPGESSRSFVSSSKRVNFMPGSWFRDCLAADNIAKQGAMATSEARMGSNWASLHVDMLELIADRVLADDLLGYVWFRAVCKRWRAATPSMVGRGVIEPRFHPCQWTMFPEGNGLYPGHPALDGYIRFLNVHTGVFLRVHLPCFEDHSVLDCPEGLLLLQRRKDAAICLRNPFTGDVVEFPPLACLFLYMVKIGVSLSGTYDGQFQELTVRPGELHRCPQPI